MVRIFLIYPTTLFKVDKLPKIDDVIYLMVEDPIYFGDHEIKMKFNKIKLVLHRASMKYYYDYLRKNKKQVIYIEVNSKMDIKEKIKGMKVEEIHCFDPTDHLLLKKIEKIGKQIGVKVEIHDNPNFVTTKKEMYEYAKDRKKYSHYHFYEWQKKRMRILTGIKSQDNMNREPPEKDIKIPKLPKNVDLNLSYVKEAKNYVNRKYSGNYGEVDNFIYPITHKTSEKWFLYFLKSKFNKFGKNQDIMIPGEPFLYHSVITPMLNIGLLDPLWIVDQCTKYYKKHKIGINNYEGYVRQIIGWREYSRMLYFVMYKPMKNGNYFNNNRKLNEKWYNGTTGIEPIDDTIKMAFKYGYIHHIMRLMVMCNFMNLCNLHPNEVYKWFMEFSCDSYDWVMTNNVYAMGMYADGGLTMKKPYISSSNYILNMSKYKKDGKWEEIWDTLYYYFLYKKNKQLKRTMLSRNLQIWSKKSSKEQNIIKINAQKYIKQITSK